MAGIFARLGIKTNGPTPQESEIPEADESVYIDPLSHEHSFEYDDGMDYLDEPEECPVDDWIRTWPDRFSDQLPIAIVENEQWPISDLLDREQDGTISEEALHPAVHSSLPPEQSVDYLSYYLDISPSEPALLQLGRRLSLLPPPHQWASLYEMHVKLGLRHGFAREIYYQLYFSWLPDLRIHPLLIGARRGSLRHMCLPALIRVAVRQYLKGYPASPPIFQRAKIMLERMLLVKYDAAYSRKARRRTEFLAFLIRST